MCIWPSGCIRHRIDDGVPDGCLDVDDVEDDEEEEEDDEDERVIDADDLYDPSRHGVDDVLDYLTSDTTSDAERERVIAAAAGRVHGR